MLRHRFFTLALVAGGILSLAGSAAAQLPGNASLKGAYNVRYLGVNTNPTDRAVSFSGTITFDGITNANGAGTFTVSGQGVSAATTTLKFLTSGQYAVLSNGMLQISSPFDPTNGTTLPTANTVLYGGVSASGVLTASSTDTDYCDLFVAIPAATSASNSTLSGNYYVASMEFPAGDFTLSRDTMFPLAATGSGSLGNVIITGTALNLNNAVTTQTSSGATYTVTANGTGTMTLPAQSGVAANSLLLSGSKVLYVSADGSFFVAGGATAYDMILGVKALTTNPAAAMTGLYFVAQVENLAEGTQSDGVYGVQGASNILSNGTEIGHQRTNYEGFSPFSYDYTYSDVFQTSANGTVQYADAGSQWAVGASGSFIIGAGMGGNYQLAIYAKAPVLTGTGVFLNPQGVVNSANSVPFTAGVAPGEFVSLYGTGMTTGTATANALPFQTTLGGAQVNISYLDANGTKQNVPAPIYSASPTLIQVLVPYSIPTNGTLLNFTVTSGGSTSPAATLYSGLTAPGIFTIPSGGIGDGAIEHADYSLVSTASPAKVGETVQIFLTGLGAVTPAVTAGTAAPSGTLSTAVVPDVYIDGVLATVVFAGLTPGSAGLYQLNVTIPSGVTLGADVTIEVVTDDADNWQATIPIGK